MSLFSLCRFTCTIERPTQDSDVVGGLGNTWTPVYENLRILLQPASGKIINEFSKRSMNITHRAYTPTEVALQNGDRLVFNDQNYIVRSWGNMAGQGRGWVIYLESKD